VVEIELLGMIAEEFAVHPGPDQPSIGVDVDLGHAELGRGQVFASSSRPKDRAFAGGIDPIDLFFERSNCRVTMGVPECAS
jgi:hypothetical protein